MKERVTLKLRGEALIGVVPLVTGLNFVGLPLQDANFSRMSDLAQAVVLDGNVTRILTYDGEKFNQFTPGVDVPGTTSDHPTSGGEAYIIEVNVSATLRLDGSGWDNVQ